SFELKPQGRYFVTNNGSALIAWQMPKSGNAENGFRIVGSHSDSPTFRIKPNPEIKVNNHYLKLNTEGYGGVILSTWFDRPLSAAGRVIIKTGDLLKPEVKLINFDKNLLTIPSLAIHMNREINDGYKFNKQKDTLPLIALINEKLEEKGFLINLIAEEAGVTVDKILDFDLYLYDRQ
ncbi:M18 family aminopeptidase, partial [Pectobacterium polaris]|nr:M18 family aminopeptidase [Pectobacterium polaris]